jgi:hypothetical protein
MPPCSRACRYLMRAGIYINYPKNDRSQRVINPFQFLGGASGCYARSTSVRSPCPGLLTRLALKRGFPFGTATSRRAAEASRERAVARTDEAMASWVTCRMRRSRLGVVISSRSAGSSRDNVMLDRITSPRSSLRALLGTVSFSRIATLVLQCMPTKRGIALRDPTVLNVPVDS